MFTCRPFLSLSLCKVVSVLAPFQAQKQSTEILVSTLEAEHCHLLGEKLQPAVVHYQLKLDIFSGEFLGSGSVGD